MEEQGLVDSGSPEGEEFDGQVVLVENEDGHAEEMEYVMEGDDMSGDALDVSDVVEVEAAREARRAARASLVASCSGPTTSPGQAPNQH